MRAGASLSGTAMVEPTALMPLGRLRAKLWFTITTGGVSR
jgi:hypothetical protein